MMLQREQLRLMKMQQKKNQNCQHATELMALKKLTALKRSHLKSAREINYQNFNQERSQTAEFLKRLALKCQEEFQVKHAIKPVQPALFNLKATIRRSTTITISIEMPMMQVLVMPARETTRLRKTKPKLNQLFQFAMDLTVLQVLTA